MPTSADRGVYCNRTLNLRSIKAIGYDMDYTLIHYHVATWEGRAYEHVRARLARRGWPVGDLIFDPTAVQLGLVIDTEQGNVVKADRFGFVKAASHGTHLLPFAAQRDLYRHEVVDLRDRRWQFMNTLFSLSEGCLFSQLVDLLDADEIPGALGYADLYHLVRKEMDAAHLEGQLKAEIIANPERFVDLDPELPLALDDQRKSGKRLLLITNSEWSYTRAMMRYAFDQYLPEGRTWRDLFDLVVVAARKPRFFEGEQPVFRLLDEEGRLEPVVGPLKWGEVYHGGDAGKVEQLLDIDGSRILYVGDHIFSDVNVSKTQLRWRTALVVRELEDDLTAQAGFAQQQQDLDSLMETKLRLQRSQSLLRLGRQRATRGYGPQPSVSVGRLDEQLNALSEQIADLDQAISPLASAAGALSNPRWGLLLRAGRDKSHLARQIERHADVYTSRVSNLLTASPFAYFQGPRSRLPHDPVD